MKKSIICALLCCSMAMLGIVPTAAQTQPNDAERSQPAQLDDKALAIKNQIIAIGQNNDITIIGKNGREFYGSVIEIKADAVSVNEIDQRATVEIKYANIKKVRKGYLPVKIGSSKRVSKARSIIPFALVAGLLALPIILLANAKD